MPTDYTEAAQEVVTLALGYKPTRTVYAEVLAAVAAIIQREATIAARQEQDSCELLLLRLRDDEEPDSSAWHLYNRAAAAIRARRGK